MNIKRNILLNAGTRLSVMLFRRPHSAKQETSMKNGSRYCLGTIGTVEVRLLSILLLSISHKDGGASIWKPKRVQKLSNLLIKKIK